MEKIETKGIVLKAYGKAENAFEEKIIRINKPKSHEVLIDVVVEKV